MARAGCCTRCHRDEPITHAEVDRAPGYWRDKQELVRYALQDLDAEPCGEDCYLAPLNEYQDTTYPYTMHDRDPPYRDEPGYCWLCGLVRPVTGTDVARDLSWWQSHMRSDTFKSICGKHCEGASITARPRTALRQHVAVGVVSVVQV